MTNQLIEQNTEGLRKQPRTKPLKKCLICGSDQWKSLFINPDRLHGVTGEYHYQRCNSCYTVAQNPVIVLEDLHLCYTSDYYTHCTFQLEMPETSKIVSVDELLSNNVNFRIAVRQAIANSVRQRPTKGIIGMIGKSLAYSRFLRERVFYNLVVDEMLLHSNVSKKVLDIGCGAGYLLRGLQSVGWEAEGVEWDEQAAKIASLNSGTKVYAGDFRKLNLPLASYDLITLTHVFEHLHDPIIALEHLKKLLTPSGRIVMITPNPTSLGAKLFKKYWYPWEVPRHLVLLSPRGYFLAAKKTGLNLTKIRTLSRWATLFSSRSRAYRSGFIGNEAETASPNSFDKMNHLIESLLVFVGFKVGEEILTVFEKT